MHLAEIILKILKKSKNICHKRSILSENLQSLDEVVVCWPVARAGSTVA